MSWEGWSWGKWEWEQDGREHDGRKKVQREKDTTPWVQKYTYLMGPHKQAHTVPIEDRVWLARQIVDQCQRGTEKLRLPLVKTLNWPAEVIDSVLHLLTDLPRKTNLRSLGETQEEVVQNLVDACLHNQPDPEKFETLIRGIIENADNHEALFETAVEAGFNPGWPVPRFDSRSRVPAGTPLFVSPFLRLKPCSDFGIAFQSCIYFDFILFRFLLYSMVSIHL